MKRGQLCCVVLMAACTVNGKPFSLGGSSPSGGMASGGSAPSGGVPNDGDAAPAPVASPGSGCRAPTSTMREGQPPFLDRPADPWQAVRDGKPLSAGGRGRRILTRETGGPTCDAQHDHCLRECVWFAEGRETLPFLFDGDKTWFPLAGGNLEEGYDTFAMYRTTPASRATLKVGALVFARSGGQAVPNDENDAFGDPDNGQNAAWVSGKVQAVDVAAGTMMLEGFADPFFLSSARVAVLVYRPGQPVQALPGVEPKAAPNDQLFMPMAKRGGFEDPWKQVDDAGQPRTSTELGALITFNQDCSSTHNHCLRPSVWMLETRRAVRPVHWDGHAWVSLVPGPVFDDPGKAYRTRPAQAGDVRVGQFVIAFESVRAPISEVEAYDTDKWRAGKIASIGVDTVQLEGGRTAFPIDNLRVPLVWWFPGEKAEKFE